MPDSIPHSIGKYEIDSILGRGGMGVVYKARDPFIGRTVAIKTIAASDFGGEDDLLARLRMEAKSAGRLTHPNIVTVFEFGEQDGLAYLVMELVEGANLANVISSKMHISLNTKLDIIIQLADGIAYAHDLGVIHRDIKPSNVCLTLRGDPKILDFGLARFDQTRLTKTGLTSGTLMYMSPERMRGESGPSDDIFALGAVAYEILTGKRAFPGEGYRDTVRNIMSGDYPIPPSRVVDVPTDLDFVIARATAIDKLKRYQTAAEFARALRDVQQSQTFQRRAVLDSSSLQDSMHTVASSVAMENPYTAPDIAPTGSNIQRPQVTSDPLDGATAVRTINEPVPEEALRMRTLEQSAAAPPDPTVAMTSPEFRKVAPAAPDPTVAMNSPEFRNVDPAALAPTEAISAPRLPTRTKQSAADEGSLAPTEAMASPSLTAKAAAGEESFAAKTRTILARAFKRVASGATRAPRSGRTAARSTIGDTAKRAQKSLVDAMPQPRAAKSALQKLTLYGSAAGIAVAASAAGTASSAGPIALLSIYAGATGAWYLLMKNCGRLSGLQAAAIGIGVTMMALLQGGVESPQLLAELEAGRAIAAQADMSAVAMPPFASLLFAGWAAIGGVPIFRAMLAVIAVLSAGSLLWDRERPQRALAVMTFPLLLIQGIVYARLEAVAAMLLVTASVATWRRRYGVAAFLAVIAAGLTTTAIAALPVLYGAAWYMIVFLSSAAVTMIVPKLIWPASTAWSTSLSTLAVTSPLLAFLNQRVAALLTEWGVIDVLNAISNAVTARAGTAPRLVVAEVLATLILVLALFVGISVMAARAPGLDAAMADGIGLLLVLCMVREPAAWLLVAPFAILGNRLLWILVAVCSPILLLAPPEPSGALTVWAISLAVPAAIFMVTRMVRRAPLAAGAAPLPS